MANNCLEVKLFPLDGVGCSVNTSRGMCSDFVALKMGPDEGDEIPQLMQLSRWIEKPRTVSWEL
jgi:hypothetical protein